MTGVMTMPLGKCKKCGLIVRLAQPSISTIIDGQALIEHIECPPDLPPLRSKRPNSY
jgi:hypothetical protein